VIRSVAAPTQPCESFGQLVLTAEGPQQDFTRGYGPTLLCVGTDLSHHPVSTFSRPHLPRALVSSLPPQHHSSKTRRQSPSQTEPAPTIFFLRKLRDINKEVDKQTRSLAQDDNSEPRRSPIQVFTAQRFFPKSFCFDLRVSLHLTTTTSCVARIMCFFPTVFLLSVSPPIQPTMDATGSLPKVYPPR
jgi:hypothetical protein